MTGLLCGRCRHDKGVSVLLNNCKSCGAANVLLIMALGMTELIGCIQIMQWYINQFSTYFTVVADILLIITIIIASIRIPVWAFPVLFYVQVAIVFL